MEVQGSKQIAAIDYEPSGGVLSIRFHYQGRTYVYGKVPPQLHEDFLRSKSKGSFFHNVIKPGYKHLRIV